MNNRKQLLVNLLASVLAFTINLGISFFLTPYITRNIGVEAYGFVSLGANFINYISLISIALNSMASRFITIEIYKDNWTKANMYFNSVLIGNLVISLVLLIPSSIIIFFLEHLLHIPSNLIIDVKLLFIFLLINYLLSISMSVFGVSTFATNKLHLKSLRELESRIIRVIILMALFLMLKPAVSFVGVSSLVAIIYVSLFSVYYTRKLTPKLEIKLAYVNFKHIRELISAGIWNSITQVGQLMLQGLDLLIANLFLNATLMGTLAVSKTVPTAILSLIGVVSSVFLPDFTKLFAKEKSDELIQSIKRSMKLLGVIVSIPVAVLASFGISFFRLWVPNEDPQLLYILSVIGIISIVISGPINSIYGVFTVTNKIKLNSVLLLITGVLNFAIVLLLLKVTSLGIIAIAGVSTLLGVIRNLVFTAPYGAKCLNQKWNTFFPEIIKSSTSFIILTSLGLFINGIVSINKWWIFFVLSGILSVLGLFINMFIVFNKSERKALFDMIRKKIFNVFDKKYNR